MTHAKAVKAIQQAGAVQRSIVQRECACKKNAASGSGCGCASTSVARQQRHGAAQRDRSSEVPPAVHDVLRAPGRPLDAPSRKLMTSRLGHDFSGVRVHTDGRAAASADAIGARAYTAGSNIVFAAGHYAPQTSGGQRLLAHELAHVIQQRGASGPPTAIAPADSALERSADRIAEHATSSAHEPVTESPAAGAATGTVARCVVQRAPDGGDTARAAATSTVPATPTAAATVPAAEEKAAACALTTYTGSNFVGAAVTADVEFVDSLDAINAHAAANDVNVHVTSSFRTSTAVAGAIVTPATMSNHLAGHAIDMNVAYGPGKTSLCNSKCLGGTLTGGVKGFIEAIQADAGLRWGGDFGDKDPVHIDDGLNVNDATAYKARHEATQAARKSGCG